MKKPTAFKFTSYKYLENSLDALFNYRQVFSDGQYLDFSETIKLPAKPNKIEQKLLEKLLESLHLMLGVSYYKLYCPHKIEAPYDLSPEQAEFWSTVYSKGLGEFLFRNNLPFSRVATFPHTSASPDPVRIELKDRILLGIGGGKDSIVVSELLAGYDTAFFNVETNRPNHVLTAIAELAGKQTLNLRRQLDDKLLDRPEGSFEGHVPISAIYAFLGLLTAAVYGYQYVVVGNEASSNFGNIVYQGREINHQWSKSGEFEGLIQEYVRKFITPDITYFSLLRQMPEIRIAEMFSGYEKYFPIFTSCNKNFRVEASHNQRMWCGECAKCAFTFLILAPFIPKQKLVNIFGKNLLNEAALLPIYTDILGFGKLKPFDCVGTFEEAKAALYLAADNFTSDVIVDVLLPKIENPKALVAEAMHTRPAPTLPTPFKFVPVRNVAILGYGKEGKVTEKFLKKHYPELPVGILDKNIKKTYLKSQTDFDLVVKTPGIPKDRVIVDHTTATNIFFSRIDNLTIGVTGSKGKSTTASLIYEIINASGKKVRLVGNIGKPMLSAVMGKVDPDEIFVIELSSYMLDDIAYSPNIAVLLNLFPEHMDYHGSSEAYYKAKQNIFKFQKPGDHALVGPFDENIPVPDNELTLLGEHNKENIKAAISVAHLLEIPEKAIADAIRTFEPLPHRLENVGTYKGITFYDDAISTTPESTIKAIEALPRIGTIMLGGTDRGYDFRELEKTLRRRNIRNVVLFPDSGKRLLHSTAGFRILKTKSMETAVKFAYNSTPRGQICLLSTASPSYTIWDDFEHKAREFVKYIQLLAQE